MINIPKKKIRIAFIAHDCSLFGAQKSLLSLLLNLDREKFEPIVIIPYEGPFADMIRQAGIQCYIAKMSHWVPLATKKNAAYTIRFILSTPCRVYSLLKLLTSLKIDIVYTNTIVNIDGALAAKLLKKKHIWHLREGVKGNRQLSSCFPTSLIPSIVRTLSSQIIVNSRWLGIHYFDKDSVAKIVYNGINTKTFYSTNGIEPSVRWELGLQETSQLIIAIGSMDPRKCHDIFIKAAEIVCAKFDNVYALIVSSGNDTYESHLKTLVEQRCLQGRVLFLGWRNDVSRIIAESDIIVLASEQEAFGRVLIEGMALKKSLVATRSGGPEEIVVDGETGFLVPIQDPMAIADRVIELLAHKHLREIMGAAGHLRVEQFFSEEVYVASLENLISELAIPACN